MSHPEQPQDGRRPEFEGSDQPQSPYSAPQGNDNPYGQSPYSQQSAPEHAQSPYTQQSAPEHAQSPYAQQSPAYENTTQQQPSYGQQAGDSQYGQSATYAEPQDAAPYGQQAPGAYGQQTGYGHGYDQSYGMAATSANEPYAQYGYNQAPAEHPQATMTLIMGILGFFVPFVSFVAWYLGGNARKEIQAGAPYSWEGGLVVGYWLGKILSIISIIGVILMVIAFALIIFAGLAAG